MSNDRIGKLAGYVWGVYLAIALVVFFDCGIDDWRFWATAVPVLVLSSVEMDLRGQ